MPLLFLLTACGDGTQAVETTDDFGNRVMYRQTPEGMRQGPAEVRNAEGQLVERANYAAGELDGERIIFFPGTEQPQIVETYDRGTFAGTYKEYYEEGKLRQRGNYAAGVMTGEWVSYYPNGRVAEVVTFADNNENGPFREWYADGKPKAVGRYLDGDKENGPLWVYGEETGELERYMLCDSGICTTKWTPDSVGQSAPAVPEELLLEEKP
ncbi:MAG: toxin-antitoxin system YwqK family antitoxin [Saprospiraceae bacterium]